MRWWDIAPVVEIERAIFTADPWTEAGFWSELAGVPDTRYYVVAEDGTGLVGYAGLIAVQREADVQTVAVRADRQGRGLGRTLLDDLLAEAGRRGCSQVLLEVRADNVAAQALYLARGFERISVRRGYYGPGLDAIVMRIRLRRSDVAAP
jgi:[ribosomal protein S18]-alanine N-acetyltransferase